MRIKFGDIMKCFDFQLINALPQEHLPMLEQQIKGESE